AKMVKDLKALGLTVLDWPDSGYWDTNSPVKPLRNLYWLAADAHAGEPCHAVSAAPYGETVELCTDPTRHPRPEADPYVVELSVERKAAQEAQREREEALTQASRARLACLQAIVAGRVPKAQLLDQLAWALIENTEWWAAQELACRILGIEPTGENDAGEEPDPSLIAAAEAGPDQASRVALAVSLAIAEARVANRWRPEWDRVTRHFAFLESHGYTVSDVERKELEIAERRRAERVADQAELADDQVQDADEMGGGGGVGSDSPERKGGRD
ncbi:MAG: hypothetical protein ACRDKW_06030, partial [Actinomycetota bacterium]